MIIIRSTMFHHYLYDDSLVCLVFDVGKETGKEGGKVLIEGL